MTHAKNETRSERPPRKGEAGVTLVELIVAAVILLIAVFAVVGVVRKSTEMQIVDLHRRQARALIMGVFETTFAYNQYPGPYNVTIGDKTDTVREDKLEGTIDNIQIDEKNASLTGVMNITLTVGLEPITNVKVHTVKINFAWPEEDPMDSVVLFKQLADVNE